MRRRRSSPLAISNLTIRRSSSPPFLAFLFLGVLALLFATFTQQMRKQQALDPTPAQQPARDQEFHNATLFIAAFLFVFVLGAAEIFAVAATAFAHQLPEKHASGATSAHHAATDKGAFEFGVTLV